MKEHGIVVVISGPSGVGKDTIIAEFETRSSYRKLAAYTTRPMRAGEQNGKDYRFVTHQQFTQLRSEHEFLDCTELKGHLYGTPLREFEQVIETGEYSVVHLKAPSAILLQRRVPLVRTVFMFPPAAAELERRLRTRGASEKDIAIRMKGAEEECRYAIFFDLIVVNYTNEVQNVAERILEFLDGH